MPPKARDESVRSLSTTPCIKAAWTRPPRPQSVPATQSAEFCLVREENGSNALPGDRPVSVSLWDLRLAVVAGHLRPAFAQEPKIIQSRRHLRKNLRSSSARLR